MKTNKIIMRINSFIGIFLLMIFLACQTGKETARTDESKIDELAVTDNASEIIDERLRSLNDEFSSVERAALASAKLSEDEIRNDWRNIEAKRHELNRNINSYNNAMERGSTMEASELRTEISRLIGELDSDVKEFRSDLDSEPEPVPEMPPDYQEEPMPDFE